MKKVNLYFGHPGQRRKLLATPNRTASVRVWVLVSCNTRKRPRGRQLLVLQVYIDDSASRDGKIFVLDVQEAVRVRTGETNHDAL